MDTEKINVLVVEPEKKPYPKEISSELASLQKEVGGYIQAVYPYEEPVAIICDEEAETVQRKVRHPRNVHAGQRQADRAADGGRKAQGQETVCPAEAQRYERHGILHGSQETSC